MDFPLDAAVEKKTVHNQSQPAPPKARGLQDALLNAVGQHKQLIFFPGERHYQEVIARRCNLALPPPAPLAIAYPELISQIQELVRVAARRGLAVQTRSGGHSYGNHSLGENNTIVIDLKNFQYVRVVEVADPEQYCPAFIGGGTRLKQVTKQLYAQGRRALPHGTCPSVGFGGHATIGGLGPMSRLYGATVDCIEEMKVVVASGEVLLASAHENADLFFALRGAAASFGIVIEFKMRTVQAPAETVQFTCAITCKRYVDMVETFTEWQDLVTPKETSRKLFSQIIITMMGAQITGTYFGPEAEFKDEPFAQKLIYSQKIESPPHITKKERFSGHRVASAMRRIFCQAKVIPEAGWKKRVPKLKASVEIHREDYEGVVRTWAGGRLLPRILERPSSFHHKSCTIPTEQWLSISSIHSLFEHLDVAKKGTPFWFLIFDLVGGSVNDVPTDSAAFPHRDVGMYFQAYAVAPFNSISQTSGRFVDRVSGIVAKGLRRSDDDHWEGERVPEVYPGYVDTSLAYPQRSYWGANLERLKVIKEKYDAGDLFRNPQSIRPAGVPAH